MARICWIIAFRVAAPIVIKDVLPRYNLLVTGDRLMQNVTEPVPRRPPDPGRQVLLILWKFLVIEVERLVVGFAPYSCVIFQLDPRITQGFFESWYLTGDRHILIVFPSSPSISLPSLHSMTAFLVVAPS
jgi:hypothetical protein